MVDRKEIKLDIGGNVIQTGESYEWILARCVGDDYPDIDASYEELADGDGSYPNVVRYPTRHVDLRIMSKADSYAEINAAELLLKSYMDAKSDAVLTIWKNGVKRIGYGNINKVAKRSGAKWYEAPFIDVTFAMPDPLFVGDEETGEFLTSIPLLTFPLSCIVGTNITASYATDGTIMNVTNTGHEECGFELTLTASGAVVNPTVTNQDGKFIAAIVTMASGDVLTINTKRRLKKVRLNGVVCKYDLSSEFFGLAVGANTLTLSADSGVANLTKEIKWPPRFRG
jgi:hypothetical protein